MKKQLLALFAFFVFNFASAFEINQPSNIDVCAGSGVWLGGQNSQVLGALSPNDYTVTYHLTDFDANTDMNGFVQIQAIGATSTIYVRVEENANPSNFEITTFLINVIPLPDIPDQYFYVCDPDGDGITNIDLGGLAEQIWSTTQNSSSTLSISFYNTQADAVAQVNAINWANYVNSTPAQQILWVYSENTATGCGMVSMAVINIETCTGTACIPPSGINVSSVTQTSVVLSWMNPGNATAWEVTLLPTGAPAPLSTDVGVPVTTNPYVITGLDCGMIYNAYIRSVCSETQLSSWVGPFAFLTNCFPEAGQPTNLIACSDTGMVCFDMSVNTPLVMGGLSLADYTVTYHTSQADAANDVNPINNINSYCVEQSMASTEIFIRLEYNLNGGYTIFPFALTVQSTQPGTVLTTMVQCDDDDNGTVTFDLTSAAAQLNTTNTLSYFDDSINASNNTNALANPSAYTLSSSPSLFTSVFIRETVQGGCDLIHTLPINALINCNLASACGAANSLCGSLGEPFSNTVGNSAAEVGNDYGCLMSQPNPTWFYLPISVTGMLNYQISQETPTGAGLDVDFICYGPFSSPTAPCLGQLTAAKTVACSYSTAAVESFTIPNAVPGEFYILMVTNFSNQPGQITIVQTNEGQPGSGDIDCTGMTFTAFMDGNGNGVKDSGESNFPLGQFHYEKNNNGNTHHITSPTGTYSIFDTNPANTYDVSFTVDAVYAANYNVSPSSFNNLSIVVGGGMVDYAFPVTVVQDYNDLEVTIIPNQAPRPGFHYINTIRYTNNGTQAASGTISFTKDADVSVSSVTPTGSIANASGFTYAFTNLQPFESREISVDMLVATIPTVNIGQVLTNTVTILPVAGDVIPENNEAVSSQIVIGSYDPNDKMESHGGRIVFSDFTNNDYLYYTIRFENSGTASAEDVKIVDFLDNKLDATTVRMIDASHEYVLDRLDNKLTWNFEDINLPFATANLDGAKGYVHFKVKPKAGYAIGDIIPNTASIFFDFNPAIVTNTFNTEFATSLANPAFSNDVFVMYPNPAGDHLTVSLGINSGNISSIAIYDMLGKRILDKSSTLASETIDVSAISSGMYFVEVTTSANQKATKKLVIK